MNISFATNNHGNSRWGLLFLPVFPSRSSRLLLCLFTQVAQQQCILGAPFLFPWQQ